MSILSAPSSAVLGIPHPDNPILTYAKAVRALSAPRLKAYSLATDSDSVDAVARYLWNMQLVSALWPTVHLLEVTFRNAIFRVGERTTAARALGHRHGIDCWLDGTEGSQPILQPKEAADVAEAVVRLGKSPKRRTAGHLIGRLTLGFWVRLCNAPYEQGNKRGPQLWPEAGFAFPNCPKAQRNRTDIRIALDEVREFRNEIAHHLPIWDRDPIKCNERMCLLLDWMNPAMAQAAAHCSRVGDVYRGGHTPLRPLAAALMSVV